MQVYVGMFVKPRCTHIGTPSQSLNKDLVIYLPSIAHTTYQQPFHIHKHKKKPPGHVILFMLSYCNTNPLTWITAKLVWITKIQTLLNHWLCSRRMYTVTHPTITKLLYNPVARPLPSSLTWVPLHGTLFPTPVLLMSLVVLQVYVTIWSSLCGLLSPFSGLYLCRICFLYEINYH